MGKNVDDHLISQQFFVQIPIFSIRLAPMGAASFIEAIFLRFNKDIADSGISSLKTESNCLSLHTRGCKDRTDEVNYRIYEMSFCDPSLRIGEAIPYFL